MSERLLRGAPGVGQHALLDHRPVEFAEYARHVKQGLLGSAWWPIKPSPPRRLVSLRVMLLGNLRLAP
jgi:hypothetical protein